MKKPLTLILLLFFCWQFSNAQYYYQPYPLAAQIASNGIEWRMECSVFDSVLGTTQYYNGPWCSGSLDILNDSMGMAAYVSQWGAVDNHNGAVIYDAELHLFKPTANDSCIGCSLYNNFFSAGFNHVKTRLGNNWDDDYQVTAYSYDLKNSSWKSASFNGFDADGGVGNYMAEFAEGDYEQDLDWYTLNPVTHTWDYGGGGWKPCNFPTINIQDDIIWDDYYDCNDNTTVGYFSVNNPINNGLGIGYSDGQFLGLEGRNFYYQDYNLNSSITSVFISTADVNTMACGTYAMDGQNIFSLKKNKNVFSVRKISNTVITYGVYSYPQHTWKISSDTVDYITSDTIINGTVLFTDSSGNSYTRGYIDSIGWGNYNTPPQPIFCLLSYNTASTGNLVYIKDYSIATDSVYIDYGDGFTTNRIFDYHLYKVNGHYRSTSAANFNVCMTAYQNGVASTPSCQVVNFVTALDEPVKQTPITIKSKGNSNILDITNKDGHALQVKVFDVAGRQIKNFNNNSNQLMLSLKTLSTGMYVVQVYDEQTHDTITGKFVKR